MKSVRHTAVSCAVSFRSVPRLFLCLVFYGLVVSGCSQEHPAPSSSKDTSSDLPAQVDGSQFLLATEPEGATDVIKVREVAKDQEDVVIVGRIGGSENPWVDGRAAFSIVDPSLKSCLECGSEGCPKPWDYC